MQDLAGMFAGPRRWAGVVAIGFALLIVAGCQEISDMKLPYLGDFSDQHTEPGDLSGTNWRAIDIANFGRTGAAESSIAFNQSDQLSGKTGCNTFLGPYRLNGDMITFGPFAMTRMMCEPEVALQEDAFMEALATATTMEVAGDDMTLLDGSGHVVMSLALIE